MHRAKSVNTGLEPTKLLAHAWSWDSGVSEVICALVPETRPHRSPLITTCLTTRTKDRGGRWLRHVGKHP